MFGLRNITAVGDRCLIKGMNFGPPDYQLTAVGRMMFRECGRTFPYLTHLPRYLLCTKDILRGMMYNFVLYTVKGDLGLGPNRQKVAEEIKVGTTFTTGLSDQRHLS